MAENCMQIDLVSDTRSRRSRQCRGPCRTTRDTAHSKLRTCRNDSWYSDRRDQFSQTVRRQSSTHRTCRRNHTLHTHTVHGCPVSTDRQPSGLPGRWRMPVFATTICPNMSRPHPGLWLFSEEDASRLSSSGVPSHDSSAYFIVHCLRSDSCHFRMTSKSFFLLTYLITHIVSLCSTLYTNSRQWRFHQKYFFTMLGVRKQK